MSNPIFKLGDLVAVLTVRCEFAIPETTVTQRKYAPDSLYRHPHTGAKGFEPAGFRYQVAHSPVAISGKRVWFRERELRRISPGEYTGAEDDINLKVGA